MIFSSRRIARMEARVAAFVSVLIVTFLCVLLLGARTANAQCSLSPEYPLGEWTGPCTGAANCADFQVYDSPTTGTWVSSTGPGTFTQDAPLTPGASITITFDDVNSPYQSVALVVVSADGCSMEGTWSDSNGLSGTLLRSWSPFQRGDTNDDGAVNIADPISTLSFLFPGGTPGTPPTCNDAMDANDDGALNIADAIYALQFLFQGGPAIPPPTCGGDPTHDSLACESYTSCP